MKILDVFSGIGGFSLGLRHIGKTVAYCDIDENCRQVLSNNIRTGKLEHGLLFEDVTRLPVDKLLKLQPDMIAGGFPCQDISCVLRDPAGINGSRSRLFFDVVNIGKQLPCVQHIFLENSSCIRTRGLDTVIKTLQKAGFTSVAHGLFSAQEVGALHRRRRWFCLATKNAAALPIVDDDKLRERISFDWHNEKYSRLLRGSSDGDRLHLKRCEMLGNSVVPQVVTYAYCVLSKSLQIKANTKSKSLPYTSAVQVHTTKMQFQMEKPKLDIKRKHLLLQIVDDNGNVTKFNKWRTPTHCCWYQYRRITPRSLWHLSTWLYYENESKCEGCLDRHRRSDFCSINPRFIEHLMGYPKDWTLLQKKNIKSNS